VYYVLKKSSLVYRFVKNVVRKSHTISTNAFVSNPPSPQIVDANTALARFDGQLESIQNPRVLFRP